MAPAQRIENNQDDTDTVHSETNMQSDVADLQKKPLSDAINIVLRNLSSTKKLFKVISTSPLFLHGFYANPHAALRDTLIKEVGEAVFQLILMEHALPTINASDTRDEIYNKYRDFFNKRGYFDDKVLRGHNMKAIVRRHRCVEALVDYLEQQFRRVKPTIADSLNMRPMSRTERDRMVRAFYLFLVQRALLQQLDLDRHQFRQRDQPIRDVAALFSARMDAVEYEQLRTVVEFLWSYGYELFNYYQMNDVKAGNITTGFHGCNMWAGHDGTTPTLDCHPDRLLLQGAEKMLEIIHLHEKPIEAIHHEARVKALFSHEGGQLWGLVDSTQWDPSFYLQISTLPGHPADADPGARDALSWSRRLRPNFPNMNFPPVNTADLLTGDRAWNARKAGFVFFDSERFGPLDAEGGLPQGYGLGTWFRPPGKFFDYCISFEGKTGGELAALITAVNFSRTVRRKAYIQGHRGFWDDKKTQAAKERAQQKAQAEKKRAEKIMLGKED